MTDVRTHYDDHLGPVYAWMTGDFAEACNRNAAFLEDLGLGRSAGGTAVDLGCGHGIQAIPLAGMGYNVIAIDTCEQLLTALQDRAQDMAVTPVLDDLCDFTDHLRGRADAIVCMGDTLCHLESLARVERLVADVAGSLAGGGVFVATFRDYVSAEARGTSRFIPVKADDERILTCFLEHEQEAVVVHDIIHSRSQHGWSMQVSAYRKIRIDPAWLAKITLDAGLKILRNTTERGMVTLAFRSDP